MGKTIKVNIMELASKQGISLTELSRLSNVRVATLSELSNGKRKRIEFDHIRKIAETLNINDINEIISIVDK
ncbi:helix-turn-helix domain-containing protein [Virgibacillus halodenitrificans]|uniref:Helix-turn-helix transcriptional regulator n=1 Tax=Virgibacillus halodenitrificans TaxID=1482 RepID=A0ABR7VVM7_VIRHA|nr:helix-turn-helix transcriptional regulator [Virgibacillus halodenitrificans]MBD1224792.1 helix-turn-helix transcriptional regulator [Virgibacillus halodenitrificans]